MKCLTSLEYAAVHALYERLIHFSFNVNALEEACAEMTKEERAEWDLYCESAYRKNDDLSGYCESRVADLMSIQELIQEGIYQPHKRAGGPRKKLRSSGRGQKRDPLFT